MNLGQKRKQARQFAYKKAIVESELSKAKIKLQLEKVEELATATNTATSLKDSTDVTNTILLEMLENQREMIKHMANASQSLSMAFYDGQKKKRKKIPNVNLKPDNDKSSGGKKWCTFLDKQCSIQ